MQTKVDFLKSLGIFPVLSWEEIKNLGNRKDDFTFFDDDYYKWKLVSDQKPLEIGNLEIKEMQPGKNGNYSEIFNSFGRSLKELVVPQNRISQILFSENDESKKIRDTLDLKNHWTHFLIEENDEFFVACVDLDSDGLYFTVDRLDDSRVWDGRYLGRFVVAV
jgi:hypothetical protein